MRDTGGGVVGVKSAAKKRSPRIGAIESAGWSIDGVVKAETSTLGSWFGVLSLEASVQVKTYDCVIELPVRRQPLRLSSIPRMSCMHSFRQRYYEGV